jgi:hypothetical protein
MGAWASDSFGDDDACDWAYELEDCNDLSFIEATLDRVLETADCYLEAPDASRAIAAVEAIARLQGNWGERSPYSEAVDKWVEKTKLTPSKVLVLKAHRAIERILSKQSELLELWQESEEFENWRTAVRALRSRVNA